MTMALSFFHKKNTHWLSFSCESFLFIFFSFFEVQRDGEAKRTVIENFRFERANLECKHRLGFAHHSDAFRKFDPKTRVKLLIMFLQITSNEPTLHQHRILPDDLGAAGNSAPRGSWWWRWTCASFEKDFRGLLTQLYGDCLLGGRRSRQWPNEALARERNYEFNSIKQFNMLRWGAMNFH